MIYVKILMAEFYMRASNLLHQWKAEYPVYVTQYNVTVLKKRSHRRDIIFRTACKAYIVLCSLEPLLVSLRFISSEPDVIVIIKNGLEQ